MSSSEDEVQVKESSKRQIKNRSSAYKTHKEYKILPPQEAIAKKLKVVIEPSSDKMKKIDVFIPYPFINRDGNKDSELIRVASIGGWYQDGEPYGDYFTYKKDPKDRYGNEVKPEQKKKNYLARHAHEKKTQVIKLPTNESNNIVSKQKIGNDKKPKPFITGSPSYFADTILWDSNEPIKTKFNVSESKLSGKK